MIIKERFIPIIIRVFKKYEIGHNYALFILANISEVESF